MDDAGTHFIGTKLFKRVDDRFDRALHVALDEKDEFLTARALELGHHVGERTTSRTSANCRPLALLALTVLSNFTRTRFRFDNR